MRNILEADSIRCSFGNLQLLTDVYLKCETGEIVGLLGRNGSGKSTLLKIIFGTQSAENKLIRINKAYYKQSFWKPNLIGYLPQENFLPEIKVEQAINLFLSDKHAKQAIKSYPLIQKLLDMKSWELSGGQKRFVEFMLLAHSEAEFLLLDEPFSAIEPIIKEEMKKMIKQFSQTKGFIITDHDYRHVLEIADQLLLINNGICRHLKEPAELKLYNYVPLGTFKS
ncbi:MAG: ATP-binding cassette domain-containing protein [Candidatus Cyclobacteriaceae bacterium M2_1C_046]